MMLRFSSLLLAATLLAGCGAHGALRSPSSAKPVAGQAAGAFGQRFEISGQGFSAEFPAKPDSASETDEDSVMTTIAAESADNGHVYALWTVSLKGGDRPEDAEWYQAVLKKLQLKQGDAVHLANLRGVSASGTLKGHQIEMEVFARGDSLLVAQVEAKKGPVDPALAARFFASLTLEQPYRIYASPTTKISVMVPAHAVEIDKSDELKGDRATMRGFFVGGDDVVGYWVSAEEIVERNPEISDDQVLDATLENLAENGTEVTWQAPVTMTGARGRDFLTNGKNESFMGRIWLTDHFIYMLMVSAKSREALTRADPAKFYTSLVWY